MGLEHADGRLGLFCFRLIEVVDGTGGGTLFEVAEAVLNAFEAEEGNDADNAVGKDAKAQEDAEEGTGGFGFADGQEAKEDTAHTKEEHDPPAVVAAFLIVDGEDCQGYAFEHHPHGKDRDKGNLRGQDVGGQHQAYDNLEYGQQGGRAGIGQKGLCAEAEDERRDARGQDEQPHEPCR